jgi:Family of unknown function (DUF6308)
MPAPDYTITVERQDKELLVIDGLAIAQAFFEGDASSVGSESYDAKAGKGLATRIQLSDVEDMNRTMRTRSPHASWEGIVEVEFDWLAEGNLPLHLDATDAEWAAANADELAKRAFEALFGPHRGFARVGKVLHLKRPRFFPVLDKLTAEMLGLTIPEQPTPAERVALAQEMMALIRREGRNNRDTLHAIKEILDADGIDRPLVRIFDAMLWFSHPAAGVKDQLRVIHVRLRD